MSGRSPEAIGWDLLRGALTTRAYAIAAELRVAHVLADGPRPVEEVAREVGADADMLHRLLRALASDGMFAEQERGVFANTLASERLLDESETAFAHLFGDVFYRAAGALDAGRGTILPRVVRHRLLDLARGESHRAQRLRQRDERRQDSNCGPPRRPSIGAATRRLSTSAEVTVRCSSSSSDGTRGCAESSSTCPRPIGTRLRSAIGSSSSPGASSSAFRRVTRTSSRGSSTTGTTRARRGSCARSERPRRPARALLIVESVVPSGNEPHGAKWLDLLMLALLAGRERDEEQWRELLASGGFEPVSVDDGLIEARCL